MDNSFLMAHLYLRDVYQMEGMEWEFFEELLRTAPPTDRAKAQRVFAATGRKGLLSLELDDPNYVSRTWHIEWLSASLGNKEKTLEYLNRVVQLS